MKRLEHFTAGCFTADDNADHAARIARVERIERFMFSYLPRWQSARKVVSA